MYLNEPGFRLPARSTLKLFRIRTFSYIAVLVSLPAMAQVSQPPVGAPPTPPAAQQPATPAAPARNVPDYPDPRTLTFGAFYWFTGPGSNPGIFGGSQTTTF